MTRITRFFIKNLSAYVELLLSAFMVFVIAFLIVRLIFTGTPYLIEGNMDLDYFLEYALSLAVGIEFIKMLCEHTSDNLIEVMLFAIAREMIVEKLETPYTLVGVAAIAGLFAIRKFLFVKFEDGDRIIFRGSQKVGQTNHLAEVSIQGDPNAMLRDIVRENLEEDGRTVAIGSVVDMPNCALRIDNMHGDLITRVEIIRFR